MPPEGGQGPLAAMRSVFLFFVVGVGQMNNDRDIAEQPAKGSGSENKCDGWQVMDQMVDIHGLTLKRAKKGCHHRRHQAPVKTAGAIDRSGLETVAAAVAPVSARGVAQPGIAAADYPAAHPAPFRPQT